MTVYPHHKNHQHIVHTFFIPCIRLPFSVAIFSLQKYFKLSVFMAEGEKYVNSSKVSLAQVKAEKLESNTCINKRVIELAAKSHCVGS